MEEIVFENEDFIIKREYSQVPWIKIFTKIPYKELTDVPNELRKKLYAFMEIAEKTMLSFYKPEKINIAIFGNYLPHLHVHIIARFKNDDFFPESMWGKKQRDSDLILPNFKDFEEKLIKNFDELHIKN